MVDRTQCAPFWRDLVRSRLPRSVEGTVIFTFPKAHPSPGSRLDLTVTAGNVQCQGQATNPTATLYYVHADHLNTPRVITDQQQSVVWRWENQEPFGNNPPDEDPDGDGQRFEFPLRFAGQYFDRESERGKLIAQSERAC